MLFKNKVKIWFVKAYYIKVCAFCASDTKTLLDVFSLIR